jgi:hypothetical protein
VDTIIQAVLEAAGRSVHDDERTRERLFSRFITRCLIEGIPVTLDVAEFYTRAEALKDAA